MGIYSFINDPIQAIKTLLLTIPAILPALVLHEVAHGYVAYRLGDPTAKLMGRLSLNPLKHLDPMGTVFMLLVGLGWAKPVPIDPRNFRHPRRDDLLVSIAGITANLIMFVIGCIAMYAFVGIALNAVPPEQWLNSTEYIVSMEDGLYRVERSTAWMMAPGIGDYLITPYLGEMWGYLYEIVVNFAVCNICLAVFNLLPVPPLDGFHVLNDLVLHKALFAPATIARAGQLLLLVLMFTGLLDKGLSWAVNGLFAGIGRLVSSLMA